MDDFDVFTGTPQAQNTNVQEDDLFGSGNLESTLVTSPPNLSSNNQQEDFSWDIENNSSDTTASQSNILTDDTLTNSASASQVVSFDTNTFADQSNTNQFDSYSTTSPSPSPDDIPYSDQTRQQAEDTSSSYEMFTSSVTSMTTNTSGTSTVETLSPLQAFNARRQQQIAEKDAEEQRKIEELRQQAKNELERWYRDRHMQMEQNRQTIKNEEEHFRTKALEQSDRKSCDWSKVIRLLEFSQGTQLTKGKRDLNRMKSTIMQATRDRSKRASENGV